MRYGAKSTLGIQAQVYVTPKLSASASPTAFHTAKTEGELGIYDAAGALVAPANVLGKKITILQYVADTLTGDLDCKRTENATVTELTTGDATDGVKHKVSIDLTGIDTNSTQDFTLQLADTTLGAAPYSRKLYSVSVASGADATAVATAFMTLINSYNGATASVFDSWSNFVHATTSGNKLIIECQNYNQKFDFAYLEGLGSPVATITPMQFRTKGDWMLMAEKEGNIFEGARAYNDPYTEEYGAPKSYVDVTADYKLYSIKFHNTEKSVHAPHSVDNHISNIIIAVLEIPTP